MKTIHVPGPPKEAFNKHRQMSDLIKAQIKHFRHLEESSLHPCARRFHSTSLLARTTLPFTSRQ